MKSFLIIIALATLASCSDAEMGALSALGVSRDITCYSGGVEIYRGQTTGKIENERSSDGYYFTDKAGNYIEINAECIITVINN